MFNTVVVTVYKHPNFPNQRFRNLMRDTIEKYSHNRLVVVGDFNIDANGPVGKDLQEFFLQHNLESKITAGCTSTNLKTTIDWCLTNIPCSNAWYYESYFSYHKAINFTWTT